MKKFFFRQSGNWLCIGGVSLCLFLAAASSGCGDLFKDKDGQGTVSFALETSDSPTKPNIAIPAKTTRFLMELIDEDGVSDSSEKDTSSSDAESLSENTERAVLTAAGADEALDAAESENTENDGSSSADENSSADDTAESDAGSSDSAGSSSVETTCSLIPASYSVSKDYKEGEAVNLSISDVSNGSWIVRVSALDAEGSVLGHVQKSVTLSDGEEVDVSGWLNPGPAPEGYLFLANPSSNSVVRLSLMSEELQTLYTSGHYPAVLFFKGGFEAGKGALLHALTGGTDLLNMKVGISGSECNIEEQYIPANNGYIAPGENAAVSFYKENGIRFYDYSDYSSSDLVYTGSGASEFSNVVNGYAWLSNEGSRDLTKIDLNNKKTVGGNVTTGDTVKKLRMNDNGSRLWTICLEPRPCVRVLDAEGNSLDNYTEQIISPSALWIIGNLVCVGESSRNEIVFFEESDKCREIERLPISEGVADVFFSDGSRLYALTEQGSLAVVDLQTRSYNKTIKATAECSSIVWVH